MNERFVSVLHFLSPSCLQVTGRLVSLVPSGRPFFVDGNGTDTHLWHFLCQLYYSNLRTGGGRRERRRLVERDTLQRSPSAIVWPRLRPTSISAAFSKDSGFLTVCEIKKIRTTKLKNLYGFLPPAQTRFASKFKKSLICFRGNDVICKESETSSFLLLLFPL